MWDVERGQPIKVIDCHNDVIFSMSLNRDGSLLATTCKDKKLRVIEPRTGIIKSVMYFLFFLSPFFGNAIFQEDICHVGSKASKVVFLGFSGRLLTTGFSRHSDRQYAIWDENDLSKALMTDIIDSSSGVVFPFYDSDTNIVFLAGKGDGNIRYYEVVDEYPYIHFLSQFLSGNPQVSFYTRTCRGGCSSRRSNSYLKYCLLGKNIETKNCTRKQDVLQSTIFNCEHLILLNSK